LRRTLRPVLVKFGQPKSGAHGFRRFRNTYLKNRTSCPEEVRRFWLGWEDKDMSDLYDKIRDDVAFRREWAEKSGLGFVIPSKKFSERRLLDRMDGKDENTRCSFHCNCLILGEVARPERFELPTFWFVGRSAKTSKCRYWYRLRATRATLFCP